MNLSAHGLGIEVPQGWDAKIYRRPQAEPNLHAANFALPVEDGDFGSGALSTIAPEGIFVALGEYERSLAGVGLFAGEGLPVPIAAGDLNPNALQRRIPGQFGVQRFFTARGRAFCLYVVVGSRPHPERLLATANEVLATIVLDAAPA
jgi:hypothetical protein